MYPPAKIRFARFYIPHGLRVSHLIGKVVGVKDDLDVARLTDEGLRLLGFPAKHPGLPAI